MKAFISYFWKELWRQLRQSFSLSEFTEVSPGVVKSSRGFMISDCGLSQLLYVEGDHVVKFYVEPGSTAYIYELRANLTWEPPFEQELISPERQEIIKDRCEAALKFRGHATIIERPPRLDPLSGN